MRGLCWWCQTCRVASTLGYSFPLWPNPFHNLHPCQLHHSSSYSAICQICMERQHARDSENVECYCKLLLMTEMWLALVTTDGTISDSWNGPWLIELYVTFILFLPFCDHFIPFSACLLTSRFQSLHAALPPDFPGLLPHQYALFTYFTSSKSKNKCTISYSIPLSPLLDCLPKNSNSIIIYHTIQHISNCIKVHTLKCILYYL